VAFSSLPKIEPDIGARVRLVRKRLGLSQSALAPLIGASRDQLASVELGRVALTFEHGWNLCAEFDLNPLWLLSGELSVDRFVDFDTSKILDDERFSAAFDHHWYRQWRAAQLAMTKSRFAKSAASLDEWLPGRRSRSAIEFLAQYGTRQLATKNVARNNAKLYLATVHLPTDWISLRARLRRATRDRGVRAALARYCKVSTAAVSQWLTGASAPTADTTLRLLNWVVRAEQKKQSGARAGARAPRKTRVRKSKHEKPNADQRG
jgi:transcriptional regulator with XRE-family HTH domain